MRFVEIEDRSTVFRFPLLSLARVVAVSDFALVSKQCLLFFRLYRTVTSWLCQVSSAFHCKLIPQINLQSRTTLNSRER